MTQHEFVIVFVAVPLAIAVGWLLWRGRYFLRNILIYTLVVAVLLGVIRIGHLAWTRWESWARPAPPVPAYPVCIDPGSWSRATRGSSCWT
ncbi:MAG TPA: hypothetical protein VK726_26410 [Acetobacteraceae bacterium]|jgi:hypothetical protein|nr:hypothetical protein [Acetobacteraceae bacterium]